MLHFLEQDGAANVTNAFGTIITVACGGKGHKWTTLLNFSYKSGGTQHTVTAMTDQDSCQLAAAAAAAQAVVVMSKQMTVNQIAHSSDMLATDFPNVPRVLAASDLVAIRDAKGRWQVMVVSSIAADLVTVTMTGNVGAPGFLNGAQVFAYGAPADTVFDSAKFLPGTSATTNFPNTEGPSDEIICKANSQGAPIILHSGNATAQGYFTKVSWGLNKAC